MILRDGYRVQQRKCFHCGRADHTIIVDEEA
jgi:hypothetical protein